MLKKENYLIVISIFEGRRFCHRAKCKLIAEARFDGEHLSTDPVKHTESVEFNQELAWTVDKKSLHQHRLQKSSIKVTLYAIDSTSSVREQLGYIILDLRCAQSKQGARWMTLLHSKYASKPEIKIGIYIDEDKKPDDPNLKEKHSSTKEVIHDLKNLKPVLNEEKGYFQIGPTNNNCNDNFIMSITISFATNLPNLLSGNDIIPSKSDGFYFYYCLMGSEITHEPFYDLVRPNFPSVKASVHIRSSIDALREFFNNQPGIEIHLCAGDQSLGRAIVQLNNLVKPASTELYMQPVHSEGSYELIPPNRTKSALELLPDELKPKVGVSISLNREVESKPVIEDDSVDKHILNDVGNENIKRSSHKEQDELRKKLNSPVLESSVDMVEKDNIISENDKNKSQEGVDRELIILDQDYEHLEIMNPKPTDSILKLKNDNSKPMEKINLNSTAFSTMPHHFSISIDLQTISGMNFMGTKTVFLKYFYPFFGISDPILTQPSMKISDNSEITIPQGFCAFDFAAPSNRVDETFSNVPLVLELWQELPKTSTLLGTAKIHLSNVSKSLSVSAVNKSGASGIRKQWSGNVKFLKINSTVFFGKLGLKLTLEDWGVIDTQYLNLNLNHNNEQNDHSEREYKLARDTQEYKAALELEVWKEKQRKIFEDELKENEKKHMLSLTNEWKARDKERELLVKKKIAEYNELESQLRKTLNDLEKRERNLVDDETSLKKLKGDLLYEHDRKMKDIKDAFQRMKEENEHKIKLERSKTHQSQQDCDKLRLQLKEAENKNLQLEKDFQAYKDKLNTKPEFRLQSEINLLNLEKSELEKKLLVSNNSKIHYKQQWAKAINELAKYRMKEQISAKQLLKRQQAEIQQMKMRKYADDESDIVKSERRQLEMIKDELLKLRQTQSMSNEFTTQSTAQQISEDDEHLGRLIEERDTLLQTGTYSNEDKIIMELDQQIRECMSKQNR